LKIGVKTLIRIVRADPNRSDREIVEAYITAVIIIEDQPEIIIVIVVSKRDRLDRDGLGKADLDEILPSAAINRMTAITRRVNNPGPTLIAADMSIGV
jgi:hypothetical protein